MRTHRDTRTAFGALALSLVVVLSVVTTGLVFGPSVASAANQSADVAAFEYSQLRVAPTNATVEVPVSIVVTVTNNGTGNGTFEAPLFVDGVRVDAASEPFAAGEERDVAYEWSFDQPGTYAVAVGDLDPAVVTVTAGADGNASANASYANLSVSPATVVVGGTVFVNATVSNPGDEPLDFVAELLVDGAAVDRVNGSLDPNASTEVGFGWSPDLAGTFEVTVGDLPAETVTVEASREPVSYEIDNCTTIAAPGAYDIVADVDAATADQCIVVLADDVVLDGKGHELDGGTGVDADRETNRFGVYVSPVAPGTAEHGELDNETISNVTIRNVTLTGWGHGLHLSGGDALVVEDVTLRTNRVGLYAASVEGLVVGNSSFDRNAQHGVRLKWSDDVQIRDDDFHGQGFRGVFAAGSSRVTVSGNTFDGDVVGVRLASGNDSDVVGNTFDVGELGVEVMRSTNVVVRGNDVSAGDVGVLVQGEDEHEEDADEGQNGRPENETHDAEDHDVVDGEEADSHESHDPVEPGPVELRDNAIADAAVGIRLEAETAVTMTDNAFTNLGSWVLYAANGSVVSEPTWLPVGGTNVSVAGRDLALGAVAVVPDEPAGYAGVGRFANLSTTSPDGWADLAFPYEPGDLPAGASPADLRLWQYADGSWRLADPPTWRYGEGGWSSSDSNAVDADARLVSANVTTDGVVGPLHGPTEGFAVEPSVENVTLEPTTVQVGESATVTAEVRNHASVAVEVVVDLSLDGAVVQSRSDVSPVAGGVESVTFVLAPGNATTHEVVVSGVPAGTLVVEAPPGDDANAGSGGSGGGAASGGSSAAAESGAGTGGGGSAPAAGSEVASSVQVAPGLDGGAQARVAARAGVPSQLDFGWLAPEPVSGVRLDSMQVTTNRDVAYDLQARTGLLGDPAGPAFDARFGEPLDYVEFDHSFEDDAVDGAQITFAVARDRVDDPESIALYRFHDGEWHRMDTRLAGATATEYVFEASTPGLSVFAVVTERSASPDVAVDVLDADHYAVGEPIPVSVTVHNPYRAAMVFDLDLRVDGAVVASERVTVGPHQAVRATFEYAPEAPGVHALTVGNVDVGAVVVEAPDRAAPDAVGPDVATPDADQGGEVPVRTGPPTTLVVVALVAVLAAAALAVGRWRRR